ncbi:hypothetical protein SAMN05421504_102650 [Amycolatopsis xylanica]|uniref:Ferredoxin n=1 Tax=Amycolatopsis xylanica TaxID=589385 RepID=A0A1H2ZUK3_9PSEU|nr:ferredoxin [Amycolatopsis xylanica]SDX20369.1 hypothetical protein SAMN05421504_102650 [Amycolatopsis xylanica]
MIGYWDPVPVIRESAGVVVPGIAVALPEPGDYLHGKWEERNWRNVPGPLYGADTDTCWCGRLQAPESVCYDDEYGQEFVYRQPRSRAETYRLLQAAWADPFSGYAMDGDEHWTPESVREWWSERAKLREWTAKAAATWATSENKYEIEAAQGLRDFLSYQDTELEGDLRVYLFWLSERRAPGAEEALPTLA